MNALGKTLLTIGGWLNIGIAILHLGIIVMGAPAYLYFGRSDLALLAARGSPLPALLTFGLALVFAGFGLYAFSGAGRLRPLPLLRIGLIFIGSVYTLRGLIVVFDLLRLMRGAGYPFRETVFSAVALAIGVIYLFGARRQWPHLQPYVHS
jgi:hypothetical protein